MYYPVRFSEGCLGRMLLFQTNDGISRKSRKCVKCANRGRMSLALGRKKIAVREDLDMRLALSCSFFKGLARWRSPVPNERLDFEQFWKNYSPGQTIASAKLKRNCPCGRITHRGKDCTSYVMRAVNRQPGFRPGTRRVFEGQAQERIVSSRALKICMS